MSQPDVSIIVLAYEDASALPGLVSSLDAVLGRVAARHEIIIVDDGSQDNTSRVSAELAKRYPVVPIRHLVNRGVGAAFTTGVQAAHYETIGYIDGDGQYDPQDMQSLLAALTRADAACGVRVHRADPLGRRLLSKSYNWVAGLLFGLYIGDVNCGFKLFRRRFLDAIGPLDSAGSFYDTEILVKGRAAGLNIKAIPVRHLPRRHGRARGASMLSVRSALVSITSPQMMRFRKPGRSGRAIVWALDRVAAAIDSVLQRRSFGSG